MIARKSALVVSTNLLTGLLNYISLYIIARYYNFPKFALGLLNFAVGFVALFSILSRFGFNQAHIKRVSEGKDMGKCNATFFSIRLILVFFMIFSIFASISIWKYVMGRGFETPEQEKAVYIMLCYYILLALSQNFIVTYRAKMEVAIAQIPFFIEGLARTIATAYFVFSSYDAIWIVYAYVIGGFSLFASSAIFFREPVSKPTRDYISSYIKFAIPVSIVAISFTIMTNLDKVLIQLFWGYEEGADYFSVVRIIRFINNITMAFGMLLLPTMSAMYVNKKMEEMKEVTKKAERYLSMILMPIVFLVIFLAKPTIHILLTAKFYTALPIVQILPLFPLFDALERPYQAKLLGMDRPNLARNRILLMLSANVILNFLLIPRDIKSIGIKLAGMAGAGAAIATVVAYFSGLLYTRIMVYKISKIGTNWSVVKHAFSAIISGYAMAYISKYYVIERWYHLLFIYLLGIGIYAIILTAIKEFKKEDFALFMDTINPIKMFSYIRGEVRGKK